MTDILVNKNLEPLRSIIDDFNNKEIAITKPFYMKVETVQGEWKTVEDKRLSLQYLYGLCRLLAIKEGKRFNEEDSILSATIDNKHRLNAIYGKQTNHDISISIRLKRNSLLDLDDFCISAEDKEKLINSVKEKKTILISGGTGTGKTTLLNSLIKFINPIERIITIENVREIEIDPNIHDNHDSLINLMDNQEEIRLLLNTSLRIRPDRIIIGELRNENSDTFLRACNTGHEGTLSTIHANSPKGAIDALIHNIKSHNQNHSRDENKLREEIRKNINIIVQLNRKYQNGKMVVTGYLEEINV